MLLRKTLYHSEKRAFRERTFRLASCFFGRALLCIGGYILETHLLIETAKVYGFPALIFTIWFIYHRSQTKAFENIIDKNFELLGGLLESIQYQSSMLTKITEQIQSNQFCPLMRKDYQRFNVQDNQNGGNRS
jgi:hypothetical protein